MRTGLIVLFAAFALALAAGCGNTPGSTPASPEDEKAAEQRIKDEAARERKARQDERKKPNAADDD